MPKHDLGDTPAFPTPETCVDIHDASGKFVANRVYPASHGMTLRQHLVGQALQGIIASYAGYPADKSLELVEKVGGIEEFANITARVALAYANAAIRALETPP